MKSSNLPSVTVADFLKIVKMQFEEKNFRPIFGLGKGGIGKTEAIMNLAKNELKIGYIDVRLLLYNETDLKGIPYPDEHHISTVWLQNNILPNEERDGKDGILVFDEITSCARSVRTAAYQLLNERRLGEYVLPEGWMVVCLGNGEEDGGDFQGMEGNFANRCSVFNVVHDLETWKEWAMERKINSLVVAYVSFKPADLHSFNPDSETEMLFASPRSWKAVSDILNIYGYNDDDKILKSRIIGNLGQRVGSQFIAFCKYQNKTIDPMEILKGRFDFKTDSQEVVYITISSLIEIVVKMIEEDYATINNITPEHITMLGNCIKWMIGLPKTEWAVMAYKDLLRANPSIMVKTLMRTEVIKACPELLTFAKENRVVFQ